MNNVQIVAFTKAIEEFADREKLNYGVGARERLSIYVTVEPDTKVIWNPREDTKKLEQMNIWTFFTYKRLANAGATEALITRIHSGFSRHSLDDYSMKKFLSTYQSVAELEEIGGFGKKIAEIIGKALKQADMPFDYSTR